MGYSWSARVRYIPLNGDVEVVDLTTVLVDADGTSRTHLTRHRVTYAEDIEDEENVNRDITQVLFGFRPEVVLTFELDNMTNYRVIARLANKLMNPDIRVQLSLDGGTTYRDVVMKKGPSPTPHRNKTIAGARFDITLTARGVIDELLPIESGSLW